MESSVIPGDAFSFSTREHAAASMRTNVRLISLITSGKRKQGSQRDPRRFVLAKCGNKMNKWELICCRSLVTGSSFQTDPDLFIVGF